MAYHRCDIVLEILREAARVVEPELRSSQRNPEGFMHTRRYTILALAVAVGWTGLAVAQSQQPPIPTITETSTPGPGSVPMLSDANIVAQLNEVTMADSEAGATALLKATRADVKEFAREMMGSHHSLHVQSDQVAKAQHITPALPTDDPFKSSVADEAQALTEAAPGRAFDSTYIAKEVRLHKAGIAWASTAAMDATSDALERLIKKADPVLHRHLDLAEAIEKKIDARTTASR